jgi:Protein of unknown function (DUF2950)
MEVRRMTLSRFKISSSTVTGLIAITVCVATTLIVVVESYAASPKSTQKAFASPEAAVQALIGALRSNDERALASLFGLGCNDLISSGDKVYDRNKRESFVKRYEESHSLEQDGPDKVVLHTGPQNWPMPIPIVKKGDKWVFDTKAGREEIIDRRIGKNELYTIQTCLAIVDAQREYAMEDREGNGLLEYAQKFGSDKGKKNGLYWKTQEGEEPSPLGELVAKAKAEGYSHKDAKGRPVPYHGYFYRILKAQGKDAPGGAFDYVVNGHMIGGFALVAYPAKYGVSGVMTFIVNYDGVVYQKDLGPKTDKTAKAMKLFDPDSTWEKVDEAIVANIR